MNISTQTIYRFLHSSNIQLFANTFEIYHGMEKMQKVKTKQIGSDDKFTHIKWIVCFIIMAQEEAPWIVGLLLYITKSTLSFAAKAWWTLVQHRLGPTKGDNVLSPDRDALEVGIIKGYEI